jgi:ribonuclease T1
VSGRPRWLTPRVAGGGSTLVAAAVALLAWWLSSQGGTTTADQPTATPTTTYTSSARPTSSASPSVEPRSGLPYVDLADLPPEAADTIHLIDSGGPFPYDEDGTTFGNYEGLLPDEAAGYYKEYTVETPGSSDRGARRIIAGGDGQLYWTADHYASFEVIRRATP